MLEIVRILFCLQACECYEQLRHMFSFKNQWSQTFPTAGIVIASPMTSGVEVVVALIAE